MEKKTPTIVTIITTLLCGLPGSCGLCMGSLTILGALSPDSGVAPEEVGLLMGIAIMIIGIGLVAIAVPIGIGAWNWLSKRPKKLSMDEVLIPEDDF